MDRLLMATLNLPASDSRNIKEDLLLLVSALLRLSADECSYAQCGAAWRLTTSSSNFCCLLSKSLAMMFNTLSG